jgi:hypothetical protein
MEVTSGNNVPLIIIFLFRDSKVILLYTVILGYLGDWVQASIDTN